MTPKQEERLRLKIKRIKSALAADKKRWGGFYDDSRGLRYLPLRHFIELEDFKGGLRYTNWFEKNFPDDICFPEFLIEWAIILFKTNKLKEAEKRVFRAIYRCSYMFDNKVTNTPNDQIDYLKVFEQFYKDYSITTGINETMKDFTFWKNSYLTSENFQKLISKFNDIQNRLNREKDKETRSYLVRHLRQLIDQA